MHKELNAVIIILLFLLTTVQCKSFSYHSHSDEAERKFSAIEREGLFHGQMSLLDWVSEGGPNFDFCKTFCLQQSSSSVIKSLIL